MKPSLARSSRGGTMRIFCTVIEELGAEERKRVKSNERETLLQRDAISFREEGRSNRRPGGQIERRRREKERETEKRSREAARTRSLQEAESTSRAQLSLRL